MTIARVVASDQSSGVTLPYVKVQQFDYAKSLFGDESSGLGVLEF